MYMRQERKALAEFMDNNVLVGQIHKRDVDDPASNSDDKIRSIQKNPLTARISQARGFLV